MDKQRPEEAYINIERTLSEKAPRLFNILPGFIIRFMKRIVHQDELNILLQRHRNKMGLEFIGSMLEEFRVKIETEGIENIPQDGRFVVASNHPLGGLDGMALMWVMGRVRKDLLFPVNDLLMNIPNLRPLFIPLNKHGRNAENLELFDKAFAGDSAILYFPAGLCSRKVEGKIVDLEWKKTIITKARRFQRNVIPTYIHGRNSTFFYNLANLRLKLGIKSNIEMFFLVNEMFKQKDKIIRIKFGKAIAYSSFDKSKKDAEWAEYLKELVYALPDIKNS
ncbi:MAG: 1-acyl-sn-glycerol-3-phosphate acyltransferase [Bacteroidales bacterium]|nr:1-acyl-sn-glycerol-3-phosphate acyltransferase [Bacteroidales bacterium]MDZ4204628.1 1-acyl-sn-glycerol-3-phosphate acyltransferase [Bacteroidales bacterium]